MHPTSIMSSNELTLCTAAGITLPYCVKCQHHYGPVCVCVCVRGRETERERKSRRERIIQIQDSISAVGAFRVKERLR